MSDALGPITLGKKHDQVFLAVTPDRDFSEEIAKAIDHEIRRIIESCYQKAQDIIENNRDKLELIAQSLLDRETLDAEEIQALMEGKSLKKLMPFGNRSATKPETVAAKPQLTKRTKTQRRIFRLVKRR